MPSPPRRPPSFPPARPALHERSESQSNRAAAPSLRLVGGPEASIYETSPYPTKPSQILRPSRTRKPSKPLFEATGHAFPHDLDHSWTPSDATASSRRDGANRRRESAGKNTQRSSVDASSLLAAAADDSTFTASPDLNTNITSGGSSEDEGVLEEEAKGKGRVSEDSIVHLPSVPPRAEGHHYLRSSQPGPETSQDRQPTNKDSDGSLNSVNSTGTVIVKKTRDGRKRASYTAFPFSRPISTPPRSTRTNTEEPSPVSPVSPSSPVSDVFASSTEHRSVSLPFRLPSADARQKDPGVQYPVVKAPAVSASWAESSATPQQRPPRAGDRWNPHLSTVHSEGDSLLSGEGSSSLTGYLDSSRGSKSSSHILSNHRVSLDFPPVPRHSGYYGDYPPKIDDQEASHLPPVGLPGPVHIRQREFSGSTIRIVDDQQFVPPPLNVRSRDVSGATIRLVRDGDDEPLSEAGPSAVAPIANPTIKPVPQENSRPAVLRPTSRASFFRESIPAWARAYYARPATSVSLPRVHDRRNSISTNNRSSNSFADGPGPAVKPRELRRSKVKLGPRLGALDVREAQQYPPKRYSPTWSPHLWHDRASISKRRSVFRAPSLDERAEGLSLNNRTLQIFCFAIGFVFPLAWLIASFLPLPAQPHTVNRKGKQKTRQDQFTEDLEGQVGHVDDARYENARWWRNINRAMTAVGISIVAIIVALAVVGAK